MRVFAGSETVRPHGIRTRQEGSSLSSMGPVVLAQLEVPETQTGRIRREIVLDRGEPKDDAVLKLLHGLWSGGEGAAEL